MEKQGRDWLNRIQGKFDAAAAFWWRCAFFGAVILVPLFGGSLVLVIYAAYQGQRFWWFPYAFLSTFASVIGLSVAVITLFLLPRTNTPTSGG